MLTPRYGLGVAAAANGTLYAIGGYGSAGRLATVEEFNPTTNVWTAKSSMPTARSYLGVATAGNGKLYAVGGSGSSGRLATVEEFNLTTNVWTTKSSMPTARFGLSLASGSNGKLYALGGSGSAGLLATVEEYDVATDVWTTKASMPTARTRFGVATMGNGKLYAIGGAGSGGNLATVEEYDIATDVWTTKSNMPTARDGLAAAGIGNGNLVAIGGYGPAGFLSTVEMYRSAANLWSTEVSMSTAREGLGIAIASNGNMYAIGGNGSSGALSKVEEYDPHCKTLTLTGTFTVTSTPSETSTMTVSATESATLTATPTPTPTPTATSTSTESATVTSSPTAIGTLTQSATSTVTNTSTESATATATPTRTAIPTITETSVPTSASTFTRTSTASATVTITSTSSPTATNSPTVSVTVTPTVTVTITSTAVPTQSSTRTVTTTVTQTATSTVTLTSTVTSTPVAPFVSVVLPSAGALSGGTSVTIVGTGFRSGAQVFFGTVAVPNILVADATTITLTSPASGVTGAVTVRVVNVDGQAGELVGGFTYLATPEVRLFSPSFGSIAGGSTVILFGNNLDIVTSVLFGEVAGSVLRANARELIVRSPAHVAGAVAITVRAPGGTITAPGTYTFIDEAAAAAQVGATRTAVAQATVNAAATEAAQQQATIAAAQTRLSRPGNSAETAIDIAIGATTTGITDISLDMRWYRLVIPVSSLGRTLRIQTAGVNGATVDTVLLVGRLAPRFKPLFYNDDDPQRPGTGASGLSMTVMSTEDSIIGVFARNATSFSLNITDVTVQVVPTSTVTPIPPTSTPTLTATSTETPMPEGTPDQNEPDPLRTQGPMVTVNGGALTRSFHNPRDIDHARFTASEAGIYVIRTSNLRLGIDTYIELLRDDGSAVLEARTLRRIVNDDDAVRGSEAYSSRIETQLVGSDVGQTFVVRITNRNALAYGTSATYDVSVRRLDGSGTATPTVTVTRTITPTRTPFAADVYEVDDSRADAARIGAYSLRSPIDHRGSQTLGTTRIFGPMHTFAQAGDHDWLAIDLGNVQTGAALVIRARDLGVSTIGGLKTDPAIALWRPDATTASGMRFVWFTTECTDGGQSEGSCITIRFTDDDAILYSGQTWYIQIRNIARQVYGDGVNYSLSVELQHAQGGTATATPTVTVTPSITRTPDPDGPVRRIVTVTRTPAPMVLRLNTDVGGRLTDSNGNTSMRAPARFVSNFIQDLSMALKVRTGRISIGTRSAGEAQRRQLQLAGGDGNVTVRSFTANAIDLGTLESISQFDEPVRICTSFQWEEVELVDQSTLTVYVVDPDTGERVTTDVEIASFTAATGPDGVPPYQPGQICFKTLHFSEFELSGGELPTPTPRPTRTPTPVRVGQDTPTPSSYRTRLQVILHHVGGW